MDKLTYWGVPVPTSPFFKHFSTLPSLSLVRPLSLLLPGAPHTWQFSTRLKFLEEHSRGIKPLLSTVSGADGVRQHPAGPRLGKKGAQKQQRKFYHGEKSSEDRTNKPQVELVRKEVERRDGKHRFVLFCLGRDAVPRPILSARTCPFSG